MDSPNLALPFACFLLSVSVRGGERQKGCRIGRLTQRKGIGRLRENEQTAASDDDGDDDDQRAVNFRGLSERGDCQKRVMSGHGNGIRGGPKMG